MELPRVFWAVLAICMVFQVFLFMMGIGDLVATVDALESPSGFFEGVEFMVKIGGILVGVLIDILTGANLGWPDVIKVPILVFCDFVIVAGLFVLLTEALKAIGAVTPFTLALLLLVAPAASAGPGEGFSTDGTDSLTVDWTDAHKAPLGDEFVVTGTASTSWANITLGAITTTGCSVITDTTTKTGSTVTWATELRMTDTTCQWHRLVTADDGIGNVGEVVAGATVRADLVPFGFWVGVFALSWWRGIRNSLAWAFPLFISSLVLLTTLLADELSSIAIPNRFAAIGSVILFVLLFLGLKAIESQRQVKQ